MSTALTHSETTDRPLALLAEGERQIAAGQYREGSATVYRAAFAALQEVAARRGWACETNDDAHDVIDRLDNTEPLDTVAEAIRYATEHVDDPLPIYSLLFINVIGFKLHSAVKLSDGTFPVTFWEPDDYVRSLPMVKKFIDLLAAE